MRGSGGVRRSRLAVLIAVPAVAMSICATAPTAAEPARTAPTALTGISGTVTDSSGSPLDGVQVQLYVNSAAAGLSADTAADGTYLIQIPSYELGQQFSVEFSTPSFVTQYWNNKPTLAIADPITVTDGETTSGIDAVLRPAATTTGSIRGKVTDASTGLPLFTTNMTATNSATGQSTTESNFLGGDGTYTITGLAPGSYTVEFSASLYANQWWNNKSSLATADQVTITAGQVATGIDAALVTGMVGISGTVTDNTGQPITGATVHAVNISGLSTASTTTASDGTYSLTGLESEPVGYWVEFTAPGYVTQWWNNQPSQVIDPHDIVPANAAQTTTGIDAVLQPIPPATLSGVVQSSSGPTPAPLAGATVVVHNYYGFTVAQTTTAADGTWSVGNLGGGVYRVEFQPPAGSGLLGQWWNNEPDSAHSDRVGVAAGATVGNINATLIPGATVSGTVADTGGSVAGATVAVFAVNASNQPAAEIAHTTTSAGGTYNIAGLQAGNYDVLFDPPAGSADVGQWYNNSPTAAGATDISLATSATATANVQLTTGQRGSISGTVTDQSGNPVAGGTVLAVAADGRTTKTTTTAADGTYTIGSLDVGMYTVWFVPPAGSNLHGTLWNLAVGKILPLTVDQGSAITGINATLS